MIEFYINENEALFNHKNSPISTSLFKWVKENWIKLRTNNVTHTHTHAHTSRIE